MKKKYILTIDQGTTSSRAVLFDMETVTIKNIKNKPFKQIYPHPGWVEHDPVEIWTGQLEVLKSVVEESGISPDEIAGIGITNQRETVVVWDKITGKPVYNAIVWQCRRTADLCNRLKFDGLQDVIKEKTGLVIDAYFSGTKIQWILENVPGAMERAGKGELLAGTMDSWLIWNLTGGKLHVTDYSNASRTMIYNIRKLQWDKELLKQMGIPECMLPTVVPSSGIIGDTSQEILGIPIPISGIAGDQQAALFGQACFDVGTAKNTYGTGCFILMNIGKQPVKSEHNLLNTIAWVIGNEVEYALEGSVFNAGSAIQWLRDEIGLIKTAHESDIEAEKVADTGGVYMVPAFTGLGAPYWDMYARGTIVGITRGTKRQHLIRAVLESIVYQSMDVFEAMKIDSGIELKELKVDGGASVSDFLMQFQANILSINVKRPQITETTALGAAYLAGLGAGLWHSKEEIADKWALDKVFTPAMSDEIRMNKYLRWKNAVERSVKWDV
ncbi:MAG TPA: glycerol kinase GlpK [Clostridiales bacterium]|nr:glycerol kinase GlpK [Clostridiales bacterium]